MKKKILPENTPINGIFSPENRNKIPELPGVYIYKDANNSILYIGKAKNLQKRVGSYFTKTTTYLKTHLLVQEIAIIDIIVVKNESEALFLEITMIKKHLPKFNINFKDGKFYPYIKITSYEEYPRIIMTRNKYNDNAYYFGPYPSSGSVRSILEIIQKTFKLRTCKVLPKKECLEYHMGRCSAPCINKISKKKYEESLKNAWEFLSGDRKNLVDELKNKMKKAAEERLFEKAQIYKDQLDALVSLEEKQHVYLHSEQNIDIIGIAEKGQNLSIVVSKIRQGKLIGKEGFLVKKTKKDSKIFSRSEILEEFIINHYSEPESSVDCVYINKIYDGIIRGIVSWLKEDSVLINIKTIADENSDEYALLSITEKNAHINLEHTTSEQDILDTLKELQEEIVLSQFPSIIECFDVAKLDGTLASGVMVQFCGGKANKDEYRMYNVQAKNQQDDYTAIEEIVYRRYKRLLEENLPLPQLIIIDGGKGQLSSALKALKKLKIISIDIISIAKQNEEIFKPKEKTSLILPRNSAVLQLIQSIRDESHRFSQHHLHKRMNKKMKL